MNVIADAAQTATKPVFRAMARAPLVILLVGAALAYWGWRQSSHVDQICQDMFAAFASAGNPPSDEFQMAVTEYANLFERLPTLRHALATCRALRHEDTAYQIHLYHTIKNP